MQSFPLTLRSTVTRTLDVAVLCGGLLAAGFALEVWLEQGARPIHAVLAAIALLGAASATPAVRRLRSRGAVYSLVLMACAVAALAAVGPGIGVGALLATGAILGALYVPRWKLAAAFTLTLGTLAIVSLVGHGDWLGLAQSAGAMAQGRAYAALVLCLVATALVAHALTSAAELARTRVDEALANEQRSRVAKEQAARVLREARELEDLGHLASGVAHDVNNALAVILCNAAVLERDDMAPQTAAALLDLRRATEAAARDIRATLWLARSPTSDEAQTCDAGHVAAAVKERYAILCGEELELTTLTDNLPPIAIGSALLELTIVNYAIRARHWGARRLKLAVGRTDQTIWFRLEGPLHRQGFAPNDAGLELAARAASASVAASGGRTAWDASGHRLSWTLSFDPQRPTRW